MDQGAGQDGDRSGPRRSAEDASDEAQDANGQNGIFSGALFDAIFCSSLCCRPGRQGLEPNNSFPSPGRPRNLSNDSRTRHRENSATGRGAAAATINEREDTASSSNYATPRSWDESAACPPTVNGTSGRPESKGVRFADESTSAEEAPPKYCSSAKQSPRGHDKNNHSKVNGNDQKHSREQNASRGYATQMSAEASSGSTESRLLAPKVQAREFGPKDPGNSEGLFQGIMSGFVGGGRSAGTEETAARIKADAEQEAAAQEQVVEVRAMSARIEGKCQKYPKTGRGALTPDFMSGIQDRYIVVLPEVPSSRSSSSRDSARAELRRWRRGRLAYWEDAKAYKEGRPEKGSVELMKIAKVSWNKEDGTGLSVKVKHKLKDQFCEMLLRFPTKSDAEKWSYAFYTFVEKIREK